MRLTRFFAVCFVAVIASLLTGPGLQTCFAQGVSVAPLRVLFDGRTRSATVFLSNRTDQTQTFRISLVNRRMLETGAIVLAEEAQPGEYFADELIRYSPRRVTIAAYGSQTIRLLVRRPRGDVPEDVEYRTHMSIRSIPPTPRLEDLEDVERATAEGQISIKAVATVETIIPIILRLGDPKATVEVANPKLVMDDPQMKAPKLTVDLLRQGHRSVYGEMEVIHIAPDGKETKLYFARGLAVYYPLTKRVMAIKLKEATPQMLSSGQLLVTYIESEDMHGDQAARLLIPLGKRTASIE